MSYTQQVSKEIGNYYGTLYVRLEGHEGEGSEKYYWGIENYNPTNWEQIPKSLFEELTKWADKEISGE